MWVPSLPCCFNVNVNCPALAAGEWKTLAKLKKMVLTDPNMQRIVKEEEQVLIDVLKENHKDKKGNAQPNNKSAAQDVTSTMDRITDEVRRAARPCCYSLRSWHFHSSTAFSNIQAGVAFFLAAIAVLMMRQHLSSMHLEMPLTFSPRSLVKILGS